MVAVGVNALGTELSHPEEGGEETSNQSYYTWGCSQSPLWSDPELESTVRVGFVVLVKSRGVQRVSLK